MRKLSVENRLSRIEKEVSRMEKKVFNEEQLEGTEPPGYNFFAGLIIGWVPLIFGIVSVFGRYFKILFFMSRRQQSLNRFAYIRGRFNFLQYIAGDFEYKGNDDQKVKK